MRDHDRERISDGTCFLGINSLVALVQVEPKIALDYQMTVMECLDDVDETLKRKVNAHM